MKRISASLSHDRTGSALERDVKIFISHSSKDAHEALAIEKALSEHELDVWPYESRLALGEKIWPEISRQIPLSSFFLLLISDDSLISESTQKELGLAVSTRAQQAGFRPIIIPIYSSNASWRSGVGARPSSIPFRDFESGEIKGTFDLASIRGHDPISNPDADSFEHLLRCLKPNIVFINPNEYDERYMEEIGFFDLYKGLFDEAVRVSEDEFRANLVRDNDKEQVITLDASPFDFNYYRHPEFRRFIYQHVSFCPVYMLYEKAIAFAFLTYTRRKELIFGSYIGVQESWRSDGTAQRFIDSLKERLVADYPDCRGMVFEVESFDVKKVEAIIAYLEKEKEFRAAEDKIQIKNFVRVLWFEGLGAHFFVDKRGRPLDYRQPCLDLEVPKEKWRSEEKVQWLGWLQSGRMATDNVKTLFAQVVDYVIVEMIAKAQAISHPNIGFDYLVYAHDLKKRVLKNARSKGVALGKVVRRKDRALMSRWRALNLKISM